MLGRKALVPKSSRPRNRSSALSVAVVLTTLMIGMMPRLAHHLEHRHPSGPNKSPYQYRGEDEKDDVEHRRVVELDTSLAHSGVALVGSQP